MKTLRTAVGYALCGMALLATLIACGTATQSTAVALVNVTPTAATGASATATGTTRGGPSGTSVLPIGNGRPTEAPSGSPQLPIGSGRPTASALGTPDANAAAPDGDGNCPADHPIKASQIGPTKTYFTSDNAGYSRNRASECFATEADADAAGYRKAAR